MYRLSRPITESEPTLEHDRPGITSLMEKGPYGPFSIREFPRLKAEGEPDIGLPLGHQIPLHLEQALIRVAEKLAAVVGK